MRTLLPALLLGLCSATFATAGAGQIPIYRQTAITQPGSYIVTRDITATETDAITIVASDVTLDLGGHTVTGASQGIFAIGPLRNVRIMNGRVRGGHAGVRVEGDESGIDVELTRLAISGPASFGVYALWYRYVTIADCTITDVYTGIETKPAADVRGHLVVSRNLVRDVEFGVSLECPGSATVDANQVATWGRTAPVPAIRVWGTCGTHVAVMGNVIHGDGIPGRSGIVIGNVSGALVSGNRVSGATSHAIIVSGSRARISGNQVAGCMGDGISVEGIHSLVESNKVSGCSESGLGIYGAANGTTVYRDNDLTGNGWGIGGGGGIDAGGNCLGSSCS